ncbi:tRNA preQ1(34) S-adenosylmethionine ribosyltransferase-isomerase QueA, partial [Erwinia amylovora]|uniref:S-adenosylmethionine:tRNA ribosyltransferase-isomerase n=1 Tax=Erwinia amylovora TaxID=552 RepID=UPI001006340D
MRVDDFTFELPESLIAHYPEAQGNGYRLLSLNGPDGTFTHGVFPDFLHHPNHGDQLASTNTRENPWGIFGQ